MGEKFMMPALVNSDLLTRVESISEVHNKYEKERLNLFDLELTLKRKIDKYH